MTGVATPISLSEYYPTIPSATQGDITQPQIPATQPHVHDIRISHVSATNPQTVRAVTTSGGLIVGIPESPIRRVLLNNISIATANSSGTYTRLRNIDEITRRDVTVTPYFPTSPNSATPSITRGGRSNSPAATWRRQRCG
jgi:hypothetical protein